VYQQVRAQTPTNTASGTGETQGQNSQISNKTYDSFTEFWQAFSKQQQQSSLNKSEYVFFSFYFKIFRGLFIFKHFLKSTF
jgi:hypothetical protein